MKKFNKTLAIAAFAVISLFSAQSAKAVVETDVTQYVQPQHELVKPSDLRVPLFGIGMDDVIKIVNWFIGNYW